MLALRQDNHNMSEIKNQYAFLQFDPCSYFESIAFINAIRNSAVSNVHAELYKDNLTALCMQAMISAFCIKLID